MRSNKKPNIKILYTIGYPLGQGGHINSTYALIKEILKIKPNIKVYLLAPRGEKANYFKDLGIELISIKNYQNNFIFNIIMTFNLIVCSIKFRINTIHAMDYKSLKVVVIGNLILWNKLIFTKAGGKPLPTKLPKLSGLIVFSNELKTFYQNNFNLHQQEKINLIKERLDISELKIKQIDSFSNCFSIFIAGVQTFIKHHGAAVEQTRLFRNVNNTPMAVGGLRFVYDVNFATWNTHTVHSFKKMCQKFFIHFHFLVLTIPRRLLGVDCLRGGDAWKIPNDFMEVFVLLTAQRSALSAQFCRIYAMKDLEI